MATTIRWLHLTDLHTGMPDQDWLWPRFHHKFRESLEEIYPTAGPWDLVLFSGDFVQKGTEYDRLEEILGELWDWFQQLGCTPQLLAVPGNHDLQWRDATDPVVKMLHKWSSDADVRNRFWEHPDGKYRQIIQEAFAGYNSWWQRTSLKPDGVQPGLLPGDFSYTFSKDGLRLGIVGLNSTFLQLTARRKYEGKLVLDPRQFQAVCDGDGVQWAASRDACFLMTHHPPGWLNQESREHLQAEILESFCLHLCGHNHETSVLQELTGGATAAPLRWLGRSLFGLEKLRGGKLDRSHGYVAGELVVAEDGNGQLQFMPKRSVRQGATWKLVPDHEGVNLPDDRRTRAFPITVRRSNPQPIGKVLSSTQETSVDAKELFRGVLQKITSIFEAQPALRNQLEIALKSDDPDIRKTARDIIDVIFAEGLFVVLTRLLGWMRNANPRRHAEQLVDLVKAFSALGVPPERVRVMRQNLESRRVDISLTSNASIAAMIAGALLDVPVKWTVGPRHDPRYDLYVPLSQDDVPYKGDEHESILLELKKRLIECSHLDLNISPQNPDATRLLEQRLRGLNALGTPVVTILREDEAAMRVLEIDKSLDWRNVLIMRRKPGVQDVVPDALAVSTVLQGILKELQPMLDSTPPGSNTP